MRPCELCIYAKKTNVDNIAGCLFWFLLFKHGITPFHKERIEKVLFREGLDYLGLGSNFKEIFERLGPKKESIISSGVKCKPDIPFNSTDKYENIEAPEFTNFFCVPRKCTCQCFWHDESF